MGVCINCGTVVCSECSTKFDGINHCAVCVAGLRREAEDARSTGGGRPLRWLGVAGSTLVITAAGYGILHMLFLW
jgi:hypothetical protein